MRNHLNRLLVLTAMTFIGYFSLRKVPAGTPRTGTGVFLPVLHFLVYFGLTAALMLHFHDTEKGRIEAVLTAFLFGLSMEVIQSFLPYRSFTFFDLGVNFLGSSIVMLDHRSKAVTKTVELEDRFLEKFLDTVNI